MRKVIFFTVFAFLLFSSFTATNYSAAIYPSRNIEGNGGRSWRIDKTEPYLDLEVNLCNDQLITFPEGTTIHWDLHGVDNGKATIVQGKISFSGTAINYGAGEVFTIETYQSKMVDIDIHASGVSIFTRRGEIKLVGSNGTIYRLQYFVHYTVNANGEQTTDKVVFSDNCQ